MLKLTHSLLLITTLMLGAVVGPIHAQGVVIDRIDGLTASVAVKAPVKATTTANIDLVGLQTIDGVSLVAGDRVLVRNQTNAVDNGIYNVYATRWLRAKDYDGARDTVRGTIVFVTQGTLNASTFWQLTTTDPVVIGTSSLTFSNTQNLDRSDLSLSQVTATGTTQSRGLGDRFADTLNVKDFGAVCNGVTDDRTAIQAAITAGQAISSTVQVPAGTCRIASALTINSSRPFTFRGDGTNSILKATDDFSGNTMLTVQGSGDITVQGITLDGNSPTTAGLSSSSSQGALYLNGTGTNNILNNRITNIAGNGIYATNTAQHLLIRGNVLRYCDGFCMRLTNNGGGVVDANDIRYSRAGGIYVDSFFSKVNKPYLITSNFVRDITKEINPASTGEYGNGIHAYNTRGVNITGNYIQDVSYSFVRLASVEDGLVANNYGENSGETALYSEFSHENNTFVGNSVKNARQGINFTNFLNSRGRGGIISNNHFYDIWGAGINIEADANVTGNMIDGADRGIVVGTNNLMQDLHVNNNTIMDRYYQPWVANRSYGRNDRVFANGSYWVTVSGGTSDPSGTGPVSSTTPFTDGTVSWDYVREATRLRYGIWTSASSGATGYAYLNNNIVFDATVKPYACQVYTPPFNETACTVNSKIYMFGNLPGLTSSTIPPKLLGGSVVYVSDTGGMQFYDGVNNSYVNLQSISATLTWDPGSLVDGAGETSSNITVTAAAFGDFVQVAAPYNISNTTVTGYVVSPSTVVIRIQNESGSTVDLPSGSWKVRVNKQ